MRFKDLEKYISLVGGAFISLALGSINQKFNNNCKFNINFYKY